MNDKGSLAKFLYLNQSLMFGVDRIGYCSPACEWGSIQPSNSEGGIATLGMLKLKLVLPKADVRSA